MAKSRMFVLWALGLMAVLWSMGQAYDFGNRAKPSDQWYLLEVNGEPAGYLHAKRTATDDDSAPILFEHELVADSVDRRALLKVSSYCEDNDYYHPVRATASIRERGKVPATVMASVEKDVPYGISKSIMQIIYRTDGKEYQLEKKLPEHTVTDFALLGIVPRLPFKKGTVFEFNLFMVETMKMQKKHKIEYRGLEKIEIDGISRLLHRFEHKGRGVRGLQYWVDGDHQLLRIVKDSRKRKEELILSTESEARRRHPGW